MKIVRAGDIMIPLENYPHIPYWFTLRQAIAELDQYVIEAGGRQSLPRRILVFDEKYRMMGMVRRRDILCGLEPEFLRAKPLADRKKLFDLKRDPSLSDVPFDEIMVEVIKLAERPVSEVMIPISVTVDFDDHIFRVIYEMNSNRIHIVPVQKDDEMVGVVRTVDVLHSISQMLSG